MQMLQGSAHQKMTNLLTPPPDKMYCPRQNSIDDIKVCPWKTSNGYQGWVDMHEALKRRQISLSPFTIIAQGKIIPVTPLMNPKTNMSSHFIIRMEDEEDSRYRVNCLFRDTDMYFMGFQRELILSQKELQVEEEKRDRKAGASSSMRKEEIKGSLPGVFYRFSGKDMQVPGFLNAKKMNNLGGGYTSIPKPGGTGVVRHIFRALSRFEDGTVPDDEVIFACCCLMAIVSEPSRLNSLYKEVGRRMAAEETESPLDDFFWNCLHSWTQLSKLVLEHRLLNHLGSHYLLPEWCWKLKIKVMREAIGQRGELLLINIHSRTIGMSKDELQELEAAVIGRNAGPADRLDPGFD